LRNIGGGIRKKVRVEHKDVGVVWFVPKLATPILGRANIFGKGFAHPGFVISWMQYLNYRPAFWCDSCKLASIQTNPIAAEFDEGEIRDGGMRGAEAYKVLKRNMMTTRCAGEKKRKRAPGEVGRKKDDEVEEKGGT
jgi:hypothetical protein